MLLLSVIRTGPTTRVASRFRMGLPLSILCLLSLPLLLATSCTQTGKVQPEAIDGSLDLSQWNFAERGSVRLSGEWQFYPGSLLGSGLLAAARDQAAVPAPQPRRVPDFWTKGVAGGEGGFGAGTYHLRVRLPAIHPDLALRYSTVSTAFELDADGRMVAAVGRPALSKDEAVPAYKPGVVAVEDGSDTLDLVVRVSNHESLQGGMWRAFVLGPRTALFAEKRLTDILIDCQVAVILALAFNALLLFLFRPKEKAYLFFALFGLSIVFRVFLTGEYLIMNVFPAMSFDTLIRLEYATVAFPLPLAAFSFSTLFPDESKPRLLFYVSLPFLARLLFDLSMVPLTLLARSIWVFYPLAIVAIIVIFVGVLLPALRHKRQGAMTILLGTLVLILSFANDSLFSAFLINTGNFLGFCLIAFMIVQSGVLTKRFSIAFDRGEALQAELSLANERLNAENERYKEAQGELQVALAEKDLLLREVHHRVKNSLQIVSSILGLQANRSGDASEINVFMMARSRIRAISLVHEKLYGIKSAEYLDLGSYARDLVDQLSWSFGGGQGGARITVKAEHIEADVDTCVDFGLMLTELVGNACKHGSAGRAGVGIVVHLERMAGGLVLRVEDDGPGFKEGFSLDASNSLGYRVVSGLVKKHDGEIVILPGPGARIELRLAIREHEPAAKGPSAARPEASAGGEEPGAGVGSFTNNGSEAVAR